MSSMDKKYGDSIRVKTKPEVLKFLKPGQHVGSFYDDAATEKMERDSIIRDLEREVLFGVKNYLKNMEILKAK